MAVTEKQQEKFAKPSWQEESNQLRDLIRRMGVVREEVGVKESFNKT